METDVHMEYRYRYQGDQQQEPICGSGPLGCLYFAVQALLRATDLLSSGLPPPPRRRRRRRHHRHLLRPLQIQVSAAMPAVTRCRMVNLDCFYFYFLYFKIVRPAVTRCRVVSLNCFCVYCYILKL